jgi:hypothetical protein
VVGLTHEIRDFTLGGSGASFGWRKGRVGHGFCCFNLRLDGATRGKAEYHLMGRLESGMWIFEAPR